MSSKNLLRAAVGTAVLTAAGLASAQVYSTYPSYGYAAGSNIVRCESINSRDNFCRVDTRGGVQIVRQLSREDCIRGRNWSVSSTGIHVDDGCRAEFAVGTGYGAGTVVGYDQYGRPLHTTGTAYVTDRYGNRIYVSAYDRSRGYVTDRYGNRIMLSGTTYQNIGYPRDRYGNPIATYPVNTAGGYYTTDRYGNRVWVESVASTRSGGYYSTDRYGNRIWVDTGAGGYYTDRYGRRVYTDTNPYDYDNDNDGYDDRYEGYGAYGGTYTAPSTVSTGVINCNSSGSGRTYCGDRNQTYTLHTNGSAYCLYNRTYGRDENGTWVSGNCNIRMESY